MSSTRRVVSLVPSVTETLLAWGVEPVAVTRFCEQPGLRQVGGTKNPDVAAIVDLRPDLVVMDTEENRRQDYDTLVDAGVAVHALAVRSVDDVGPALRSLAERVGVAPPDDPDRPEPAHAPGSPRAYVPIWRRPWMALGTPTYASSLLEVLGVDNVAAGRGPYPELAPDDARTLGADLVLAPSEPYAFGPRHRTELSAAGPVVFVDGKDLFWWGARTPGAIRRLSTELSGIDAR